MTCTSSQPGQGGHQFSTTLAEHDAALRVYLAHLREA